MLSHFFAIYILGTYDLLKISSLYKIASIYHLEFSYLTSFVTSHINILLIILIFLLHIKSQKILQRENFNEYEKLVKM